LSLSLAAKLTLGIVVATVVILASFIPVWVSQRLARGADERE